jgi:hypothetical protein
MSLIGSVPTPYIFDDRADFRDAAAQIQAIYELTSEERKRLGRSAREWTLSDEAMMTSTNMSKNVIKYINQTFDTWIPRKSYDFIQIKELSAKQNKTIISL